MTEISIHFHYFFMPTFTLLLTSIALRDESPYETVDKLAHGPAMPRLQVEEELQRLLLRPFLSRPDLSSLLPSNAHPTRAVVCFPAAARCIAAVRASRVRARGVRGTINVLGNVAAEVK